MNNEHSTVNGCLKICVIGEVKAVINKIKWMLNRETVKLLHLATPMWVGTQPLQLQGSITSVTLYCLDVLLEQMSSRSVRACKNVLRNQSMLPTVSGKPPFTIDNHIIYWFNSWASSQSRSAARYPADHKLQGNLHILLCRAQTVSLKGRTN